LNKKLSVFDQLCESNLKLAHSFCCISKVFVVPMGDPGLVKGERLVGNALSYITGGVRR